jgi:hypothetical protein
LELLKEIAGEPFAAIDTDYARTCFFGGQRCSGEAMFDFDVVAYLDSQQPDPIDNQKGFHVSRYIKGIQQAALLVDKKKLKPGLLIDTISTGWNGHPTCLNNLAQAAVNDRGEKDSYGGWAKASELMRQLYDAMLHFPGHLVVTAQSEPKMVPTGEMDKRGRPKMDRQHKLVYKDNLTFGFDAVFCLVHKAIDVDSTFAMTWTKVINPPPGSVLEEITDFVVSQKNVKLIEKPGPEFARIVKGWLNGEVA